MMAQGLADLVEVRLGNNKSGVGGFGFRIARVLTVELS
jgi:hypothetical protein